MYRTDSAVAATYTVDGGAGEDEIEVDAGTVRYSIGNCALCKL